MKMENKQKIKTITLFVFGLLIIGLILFRVFGNKIENIDMKTSATINNKKTDNRIFFFVNLKKSIESTKHNAIAIRIMLL